MSNGVYALILAAGKGTRMKSKHNKVLHQVCGMSMVEHVIYQLKELDIEQIGVVVGHQKDQVMQALGNQVHFIEQKEQLGTGHAVMVANEWLASKQGTTFVLCGDTPLLTADTLQQLLETHRNGQAVCTVLTAIAEDSTAYGRIVRDEHGKVMRIVEQKDASDVEKQIKEVNSGIYCFDNQFLFEALSQITDQNAQKEYYLTDVIEIFNRTGRTVLPCTVSDFREIVGVNDRVALAKANEILNDRLTRYWMQQGVTILDPHTTYIELKVKLGTDITLYPGVHLRGNTIVEEDCIIGPNVEIEDCHIGQGAHIKQSVLSQSTVGQGTNIGPFAYVRPGSKIGANVKIGDFVEIKNAIIGDDSKISHLSYIGDAEVGKNVNIGCGTVTVNYDGKRKHKTIIEDNSFVGCNSNLVAPVTVAENSYVAAGSTITDNVPKRALAIARNRQVNKLDYIKE
ncbi:UDP-N-acetylglucosamine diphosphorylase/glucosamine-1-phosphate N-acetyltransferase [Desulfuribacillus stibiiarsenatis]|uniref:Bifunctional protein GlmU n=1 Tax=Desulfuribacillus stibiiarsenatis TaxID=1390249 RepID=A0A1E5L2J4_9FIRM|nr:bifunctional UDP-N-acetylglucosamine diphosphorylase/glucosamine-1-phosphate N-acetyltransferase GlmU [Desulfuribacillus stibiiarsenatis]OEH84338.1 UDP-N-acetylglucosamine diphosphorylase/glucosamine-1-phosphate N-acetyltransferase [Desulfuribacillus stibiiarsenatis]